MSGTIAARVALLCVAAVAAQTAQAELRVMPRIAGGALWSDNIDLAGDGAPRRNALGLEARPAVAIDFYTQRARVNLDYSLSAYWLEANGSSDRVWHTGRMMGEVDVVKDWFRIGATGSYLQQIVQLSERGSYGGFLGTENVTDTLTYRVTPTLDHEFAWGRVFAEYAEARTDYKSATLDDPRDRTVNAYVMYGLPDDRVTLRAGVVNQQTSFDRAQTFVFNTALAEVGVRATRNFRLLGQVGRESDLEKDPFGGGYDLTFWRAGGEWRPDRFNELRALVGHRFYGNSYEFSWTRTARVLTLRASYAESPMTQSSQYGLGGLGLSVGQIQRPQLDPTVEGGLVRATSDPFLDKRLTGLAVLSGRLTNLRFEFEDDRRSYLNSGTRDHAREYRASADRRFGPLWTVRIAAANAKQDLREVSFVERRYDISADRRVGRDLSIGLSFAYVRRSSAAIPYDVMWARFGFSKQFGPTPGAMGAGAGGDEAGAGMAAPMQPPQ